MAVTVLLDVDGTLVDNSYLHTVAWWRACRDHGVAAPMAVVHRLIGMGGDQLVPALTGGDDPRLEEAHLGHYRQVIAEVPVIDGADQLINELHRRGATVAVATSSNPQDLATLLGKLHNRHLIDRVISSEEVETSKPAPDLVGVALRETRTAPEDAVLIGDTGWDVEAAGRAGVACVAVRSGGWGAQELAAAGAAEVHDDVADLLAHLEGSLIGRRLSS